MCVIFCICLCYFPGGSDGKESACNARDLGSIPGSGRSPGAGNDNPPQYSCLENSMDRGAWWATVRGDTESDKTEHISLSISLSRWFLVVVLICISIRCQDVETFHVIFFKSVSKSDFWSLASWASTLFWTLLPGPSQGHLLRTGVFPYIPRRPGEDASISTGFCCYKSRQKATASLHAPLVFFVLVLVIEHLFSITADLISKVFVLDVQELGWVIHKHVSIWGEGGLFQNR